MGLFDFIGDIFNSGSQLLQNERNIQLQMAINRQNQKNFNRQLDFSRESQMIQQRFQEYMYNKSNDYNSAASQRRRLESAGLNPYMMLNGGSAGTASSQSGSSTSTPSAPQLQAPQLQAPQFNLENFSQLIDVQIKQSQKKNIQEQTKQLQIDNQYRAIKTMSEIDQIRKNTRNVELRNEMQEIENRLYESSRRMQMENMQAHTAMMVEQYKGQLIKNAYDFNLLQNQPEQIRLQNLNLAAEYVLKIRQGELTKRQAVTEFYKQANIKQDTAYKEAQTFGQEESNSQAMIKTYIDRKTAEAVIDRIYNESERSSHNIGPDGLHGIPNLFVSGSVSAKKLVNSVPNIYNKRRK